MFTRRYFLPALTLTLATLGASAPIYAQQADEAAPPEVENSRYQFVGAINGNDVPVRSGPSEGHYATVMLEKDQQVTVVGIKLDWLKILPPQGSFSYVAKAFVEKRGDGTVGRVMKSDLNVRAGSTVSSMKTQVQTRLAIGDDVQIVGEQDEYFKIKPPAGAYLYVNKRFVDPVRAIGGPGANATPPVAGNDTADTADIAASDDSHQVGTQINPTPDSESTESNNAVATTVTPTPVAAGTAAGAVAAPTTKPVAVENSETQFDQLEARLRQTASEDLAAQPIGELLDGYAQLASDKELPDSLRRIAESRVGALKVRQSAREELLTLRKEQEDHKQQQVALKAEQQELQEHLATQQVQLFTAVGVLRPSSLQDGQKTLYRITDPTNGRTLVYIRTSDERVTQLMGRFIGVKGAVATDPELNLQVVRPDSLQPVDPVDVGNKVAAQFVPPTLLNQNATASVPQQ